MTGPIEVYGADGIRPVADVVLASLPLSYSPGRSISGSVAVIAGSGDWPSAVADALDEGAVGVIVVWPRPADTEGLRARSGKLIGWTAAGRRIRSSNRRQVPSPMRCPRANGSNAVCCSVSEPRSNQPCSTN